jgi:hypothetical protein
VISNFAFASAPHSAAAQRLIRRGILDVIVLTWSIKTPRLSRSYLDFSASGWFSQSRCPELGDVFMSISTVLAILLLIFLLGGFSGRFGGYGYGYGHGGVSAIGLILIILVVLMLLGRI